MWHGSSFMMGPLHRPGSQEYNGSGICMREPGATPASLSEDIIRWPFVAWNSRGGACCGGRHVLLCLLRPQQAA